MVPSSDADLIPPVPSNGSMVSAVAVVVRGVVYALLAAALHWLTGCSPSAGHACDCPFSGSYPIEMGSQK